jgi:uncharacterized protein (TIGR04141 family)
LSFSAFLLRADQVQKFESALVNGRSGLELAPPLDGIFIPLASTPAEPAWLALVRRLLVAPGNLTLQSQSPGGLIFVRHASKHFVLTFGQAWHRLEDEWLEHDFGRRVALNSIARDKIVAIRAEQVFAKGHLANERAPRASSVDEFGVEFDRDLVSAVEGLPGDEILGKSIRGATSLRTQLPLSGLAAALDRAADLFDSDDYKKTWPELDNMGPVKDSVLVTQLETELDTEFASGTAQRRLNLFTPDQRHEEGAVPDSYVFGRMTKTPATSPYLMVDSWLNYLQNERMTPSVHSAKQCRVHLMDEAKEEIRSHSVFDCFGYELVLHGKQYILSSGIWYEVVDSFVRRINQDVGRIAVPMINLPTWNQTDSEGEYNEECCACPASFTSMQEISTLVEVSRNSSFAMCFIREVRH